MSEEYTFFRPTKSGEADELGTILRDSDIIFKEFYVDRQHHMDRHPITLVNKRGTSHGFYRTPDEIRIFALEYREKNLGGAV